MEGQVGTVKERKRGCKGHSHTGNRRRTSQASERKRRGEEHSLSLALERSGGKGQDNERKRASEGHPLSGPGEHRGMDKIKTAKESLRARGTHILESVEGGTIQGHEQK